MPVTYTNTPDSNWDKVYKALANPKFDFRTVSGISGETGLGIDEVQRLLDEHKGEVRIAYATDSKGRLLYTLQSRPKTFQEYLSTFKTVVSSSSTST